MAKNDILKLKPDRNRDKSRFNNFNVNEFLCFPVLKILSFLHANSLEA